MKTSVTNNMPFYQRQQILRERALESLASGLKSLRTTWHHIVEWKIWSRLTPLIIAVILFGFRIVIFLIEKFVYISNRIIERMRSHH